MRGAHGPHEPQLREGGDGARGELHRGGGGRLRGAGRGPGARVRPSPVRSCTAVTRDGAPVATGGHPHGQKSGS